MVGDKWNEEGEKQQLRKKGNNRKTILFQGKNYFQLSITHKSTSCM